MEYINQKILYKIFLRLCINKKPTETFDFIKSKLSEPLSLSSLCSELFMFTINTNNEKWAIYIFNNYKETFDGSLCYYAIDCAKKNKMYQLADTINVYFMSVFNTCVI